MACVKTFGTGHFLLMILEFWKETVDKNKAFGALKTDILKSFSVSFY